MSDIYIQVKKGGGGMATGPLPPPSPAIGDRWAPHPEVAFVAVRSNSNTDEAAYSYDGNTWQTSNLPFSDTWIRVEYFNGMFIAVPRNLSGNDQIAYSWNGIDWDVQTVLPSYTVILDNTYMVKGADGIAFTFSNSSRPSSLFFSRDGLSWDDAGVAPSDVRVPLTSFGENGRFIFNHNTNTRVFSVSAGDRSLVYGDTEIQSNREINSTTRGLDGHLVSKQSSRDLRDTIDFAGNWTAHSDVWANSLNSPSASCIAYPNGDARIYWFGTSGTTIHCLRRASLSSGLSFSLPNAAYIQSAAFGLDKIVATERDSANIYYSDAAGEVFSLATGAMPVSGQWQITGRMVDRAETPRVFDGTNWIIPLP